MFDGTGNGCVGAMTSHNSTCIIDLWGGGKRTRRGAGGGGVVLIQ